MAETAPRAQTLEVNVPAPAAASTVQDTVIGEVQAAGTVSEVTVISEGAVVANATNFRTLAVVNKGQTGAGTTAVATLALDTPTTDDLAAKDEKTVPLSGTAGNLAVVAGDVLILDETVTSAGLAHTGLQVKVTIQA